MAAENDDRGTATGADAGEARRRNVSGQPNGNHIPTELEDKVDEKTKEKVCQPGPALAAMKLCL